MIQQKRGQIDGGCGDPSNKASLTSSPDFQQRHQSKKKKKNEKKKASEAYLGSEDFQGKAVREERSPEK